MTDRRLGVYICYCGGNISDYVEVEKVREAISRDPGVVVAKTTVFACSDAAQEEMIEDIKSNRLDGLVVASCSPKLHLYTFRAMAERAGLNPYQYVQVNLREQDSWVHQHDKKNATEKGIRLVRAGIAKCSLTEPLSTMRIDTAPRVLVIGAGVAGLRAALSLSDMGLTVYVIERESGVGGWTGQFGRMYPNDNRGSDLINSLHLEVKQRDNITIYTRAELMEKSGSIGDFSVVVRAGQNEKISLNVGAIIVATGFDVYKPAAGEFGHGHKKVITLPEFKKLLDNSNGNLTYEGRTVKDMAYIYCVGSRQPQEMENPHLYCSRYCCTAAVHTALEVNKRDRTIHQFHLYRDMRTYGRYELLYKQALNDGSKFIKYADDDYPQVENAGDKIRIKVKDQLTQGDEFDIHVDLLVLVTGMVPRENAHLVEVLKLPVGKDGFFNEIHPKLRPVETVIDGVFIAGASQGPKTLAESVASSLAAVSKSAALLMKGYVDLEPLIAKIDPEKCVWCDECTNACPYGAIEKGSYDDKEVARIIPSLCKGGGACVPLCPRDAIDVAGYTDVQITAMIDSLIKEVK
ncbi:MAG: CoB--CoM heterodisulfide reductase iron-sulfur subunit A family protein [Candidatus Zixiibacteriota bacterium]